MKLLSYTLPQIRYTLAHGKWFSPAVIVSFGSLEFLGRKTTTDFNDPFGVVALVFLLSGIALRHRVNPIPWVKKIGGLVWKLARFGDRFKVEIGPDLRGQPAIPSRLPPFFYYLVCGLVVWSASAFAIWHFFPQGWRDGMVQVTYLGYLASLLLLWGMLFVASLGGIYFPIMLLSHMFPRSMRPGDPKISRTQIFIILSYLLGVAAAAQFLPPWPGLAICGVSMLVALVVNISSGPAEVQFIWRYPDQRQVWSIPTSRLFLAATTLVTLTLTALILSASGGHIGGVGYGSASLESLKMLSLSVVGESIQWQPLSQNTMPLTTAIGKWTAWFTPGLLVSSGIFLLINWRNSPSHSPVPLAHIANVPSELQPAIWNRFASRNWIVSFSSQTPDPTAVRLELVDKEYSEAQEFDPKWPLRISMADLIQGSVFERFERRDEIQCRRALLRGIERLFKEAKQRKSDSESDSHEGGCGIWLAPHLWFVPGMTRDEVESGEEEPSFLTQIVGTPYREVFHPHVRQYAYRLLRGLQVDLIFVEDGINYRKLNKVLRPLIEVYDKSAGTRRADETHFQGIPKVRVLIHEFVIDDVFRSENYPEPRFEDLGRARILHLFRDRGDHEETVETPWDFDETPAPHLVGN